MSETTSYFHGLMFIETINDLNSIGETGNIGLYNGEGYVWVDNKWEKLGTMSDLSQEEDETPKKIRPQLCQCCGAALHGDTCDYCGVEYR